MEHSAVYFPFLVVIRLYDSNELSRAVLRQHHLTGNSSNVQTSPKYKESEESKVTYDSFFGSFSPITRQSVKSHMYILLPTIFPDLCLNKKTRPSFTINRSSLAVKLVNFCLILVKSHLQAMLRKVRKC